MIILSREALRTYLTEVGLVLHGVTSVDPVESDISRLAAWVRAGYAGELHYMKRDPALFGDPSLLKSRGEMEFLSVISVGASYSPEDPGPTPRGYGRVARYAWGKDYHEVLSERLSRLLARIREDYPMAVGRVYSDAVPLLERAFARRAGVGFVGKNTMLIRPRLGSYFFLGEILSNVVVSEQSDPPPQPPPPGRCGPCTRCLTQCPTNAFVAPYVLDARRCISYLTIEKRGELSDDESMMLGSWLFGCDICQEVCPFNVVPTATGQGVKRGVVAPLPEFSPLEGVGPFLELEEVLSIEDDEQFRQRFRRSPLRRTKREGLLRNACAVVANTRLVELLPLLEHLSTSDQSPIIRSSAYQAMTRL